MSMRDYEDMKDIVIPKEQEEMMNIICDALEECRTLKNCEECPTDRKKKIYAYDDVYFFEIHS